MTQGFILCARRSRRTTFWRSIEYNVEDLLGAPRPDHDHGGFNANVFLAAMEVATVLSPLRAPAHRAVRAPIGRWEMLREISEDLRPRNEDEEESGAGRGRKGGLASALNTVCLPLYPAFPPITPQS